VQLSQAVYYNLAYQPFTRLSVLLLLNAVTAQSWDSANEIFVFKMDSKKFKARYFITKIQD
jgi:hypothetical protein